MDAIDGQIVVDAIKQLKECRPFLSVDDVVRIHCWIKHVSFFHREYGSALYVFEDMLNVIPDLDLINKHIHQKLWTNSAHSQLYFVQQLYVDLRYMVSELIFILIHLETKTITRGRWWWKRTEPIRFSQLPTLQSYMHLLQKPLTSHHLEFYDSYKVARMCILCNELDDAVDAFIYF